MVYPVRGITDYSDYVLSANQHILDFLREDGFSLIAERIIAPSINTSVFSKALDRSVTGHMNDFVYQAQGYLEELSPIETSQRLNETPLLEKPFSNPRDGLHQIGLSA